MGQCLCSWCVEARLRARDAETADLRGLAAYDQARDVRPAGWDAAVGRILAATPALSDADLDATLDREDRAAVAGERALAMREARKRARATCP